MDVQLGLFGGEEILPDLTTREQKRVIRAEALEWTRRALEEKGTQKALEEAQRQERRCIERGLCRDFWMDVQGLIQKSIRKRMRRGA